MRVFGPADVLLKVPPKLLRQRKKNLIFVIYRVLQEGYQLIAGAVRAQCKSNGRYAVYGVQPELNVL